MGVEKQPCVSQYKSKLLRGMRLRGAKKPKLLWPRPQQSTETSASKLSAPAWEQRSDVLLLYLLPARLVSSSSRCPAHPGQGGTHAEQLQDYMWTGWV